MPSASSALDASHDHDARRQSGTPRVSSAISASVTRGESRRQATQRSAASVPIVRTSPDTLGRLTSTNRRGRCCLAAFLMGWAVTAPPELSPADGDGPSPAWTVHPPGSVAPSVSGLGRRLLLRPAFGATWLAGTRCYWRTLQKRPAPAPTPCGGRRSPFSITRSNLAFQVTSPGLPIRFRQRLQDSFAHQIRHV